MRQVLMGTVSYIRRHAFISAVILGLLIILSWTVYQFFNSVSTYDLVGQQVYARQLLIPGTSDATIGATHYLVKLLLVYIPFEWLHLSPRFSLIAMTVLINSISYVLIALALRRIVIALGLRLGKFFYLGLVWMAACSVSLFWIEFTNSRNIEVAAGVWLVALGLTYARRPSRRLAIGILGASALSFFMDPLQVFMTGVPLLIYCLYKIKDHSKRYGEAGWFIGALVVGYCAAWGLMKVAETVIGFNLLDTSASGAGMSDVLHHMLAAIKAMVVANVRFFTGVLEDGGRLRQVITLVGTGVLIISWVVAVFKRQILKDVVMFVVVFAVVIEGIYALSGQSLSRDTSRYLIMIAPVFVVLIASLSGVSLQLKRIAFCSLVTIIVVNSLFAVGLMVHAWPQRFLKDEPLAVSARLATDTNTHFYASLDNALPTDYYYPHVMILPLACNNQHRLQQAANTFSRTAFLRSQQKSASYDAIILVNNVMTNYPSICTKEDIIVQFPGPLREVVVANQTVLYYQSGFVARQL
jgi:hypothetical protein